MFLDELGDLDPAIQVKLLRVIETRTFHPVGDTAARQFRGKLIAATNRDLADAMRKGRFREDLYYRLCSDQIATPSLAEQLADSPQVLRELVFYMSRRVAGAEGDALAGEVLAWIEGNLARELRLAGQLSRTGTVRQERADPPQLPPVAHCAERSGRRVRKQARAGTADADDLLSRYVTIVYSRTGSYEETARRLGLDRRTVKAKVDPALLKQLQL